MNAGTGIFNEMRLNRHRFYGTKFHVRAEVMDALKKDTEETSALDGVFKSHPTNSQPLVAIKSEVREASCSNKLNQTKDMNNNLPRVILIAILITTFSSLHGQMIEEKRIGNGIYILPTQLIFSEILLTYEHFLKDNLSGSVSFGYKIPTGKGESLEPFGSGLLADYENQYMLNEYSHGLYFSISPSFYLKDHKRFYLSPELFYRYYWFNDKKLFFDNVETDRYNSIRSEQNHVIGLKLLAGFNSKIVITEKKAIAFKIYTGLSTRFKIYKYENIDNILEDGTIVPFQLEQGTAFRPVAIHLGLKIGLSNLKPISK